MPLSKAHKPKVLILSSAEIPENKAINDAFVAGLNAAIGSPTVEWTNYHNVGLELAAQELRAFTIDSDTDLRDYKAVYFKSYFRYHEQATAIAEVLAYHGTRFVGSELQHYIPAYKLSQMARLARAGFRIPQTIYLPTEHYMERYEALTETLGVPFIFKAIDGSTGDDNYLVESYEQLAKIVAKNGDRNFIAQSFVPNNSDFRVVTVDGEVKLIIERRRINSSTHLNNTSQGAQARLIEPKELPPALRDLCKRAAAVMERDVAGVDLMLEEDTGTPYILEVNASPQIGSGAFGSEKLTVFADFFKQLANKPVHAKTLVGRAEPVFMPEFNLGPVVARVDTGAKTSALWASGVQEKDGMLEYRLFGPESPDYTGEIIRTAHYGQRLVSTSTGHVEQRYTIKTPINLKGRKVNATFTLANRSQQVYPILVGRNVLSGKFTVDVSLGQPLVAREKQREAHKRAVIDNVKKEKDTA